MRLIRASAFAEVSLFSPTAVPAIAQSGSAPAAPIESVAAGSADEDEDEQLRSAQEIVRLQLFVAVSLSVSAALLMMHGDGRQQFAE